MTKCTCPASGHTGKVALPPCHFPDLVLRPAAETQVWLSQTGEAVVLAHVLCPPHLAQSSATVLSSRSCTVSTPETRLVCESVCLKPRQHLASSLGLETSGSISNTTVGTHGLGHSGGQAALITALASPVDL
jgi:hypothetical protein